MKPIQKYYNSVFIFYLILRYILLRKLRRTLPTSHKAPSGTQGNLYRGPREVLTQRGQASGMDNILTHTAEAIASATSIARFKSYPALVLNLLKDILERSKISFNKFRTSAKNIKNKSGYLNDSCYIICKLRILNSARPACLTKPWRSRECSPRFAKVNVSKGSFL